PQNPRPESVGGAGGDRLGGTAAPGRHGARAAHTPPKGAGLRVPPSMARGRRTHGRPVRIPRHGQDRPRVDVRGESPETPTGGPSGRERTVGPRRIRGGGD